VPNGRVGWLLRLGWWPVFLILPQTMIRMYASSRVYGWKFATSVPIRVPWANFINFCAAAKAVRNYVNARIRGVPLRWLKTEHAYPNRAALVTERRKLGDILVGSEYVTANDLDSALNALPPGGRIGEYLVQLGKLSEEDLYEALSLQNDLPRTTDFSLCPSCVTGLSLSAVFSTVLMLRAAT
jgi:adsorption protein B